LSDEEVAEFDAVLLACARSIAETIDRVSDEGDSEDVDEQ